MSLRGGGAPAPTASGRTGRGTGRRERDRAAGAAPYPILPSVVAVIVYLGLVSIACIWIFVTARYPTEESTEPFRLLTTPAYAALSVANTLLLAGVAFDAFRAWRSRTDLRGPHVAGAALAALGLALVQIGAHYAHAAL